jgi:hypothetical protein
MSIVTNKELTEQINNVYTAMFLLDEHREEIAKSKPSNADDVDGSELECIMDLKAASKGLKEVADVLRKIRSTQLKGYHA